MIVAILLLQVLGTFEYQGAWSIRTLSGVRTATKYHTILCNQGMQPRSLQGLQVLTEVRKHVTYINQAELQSWIDDQQKTKMSIYRGMGYFLAGSGYAFTAIAAGQEVKIKEKWILGSVPAATAFIGGATIWLKSNPPRAVNLPSNLLPSFISLTATGLIGSCRDYMLLSQPQLKETTFEVTIQ